MGREMKDEQVVGLSTDTIQRLSRLRDMIDSMLDYPTPMTAIRPKEPWVNLSDRYDIIIGDFGIKDLSNSVLPPSVLSAPKQLGNASSLPGTDQWPNVAGEKKLNPEWITADHEYPIGTKTAWKLFIESQASEQIEEKDEEDLLGFREMFTEEQMKAAFRAGYEEGRKAK